jgi:ribonucleoside-diphosphate reductase alpha chain
MSENKVILNSNPSNTIKVKTACGNIYTTVTTRNIFFFTGKNGGCSFSFSESLGRLATLVLEKGGTLEEIQKQLQGIRCPSPHCPTGKVEDEVLSCADGISRAIGVYLKDKKEGEVIK